jgi:hypothetical protein
MFDLEVAIKDLANVELDDWSDAELSEAVVELARLARQLDAVRTKVTARWDARRVWAADGARTGAAWLAHRTREPKVACAARLGLGRAMRDLPVAAEAWLAGDLDAAHVRRLAGARNERTADAMARDEALLVHEACTLDYRRFDQLVAYWSLRNDPDGTSQDAIDQHDRRTVTLARGLGGSWFGALQLDPVAGTIVDGELRRLYDQLFHHDWNQARDELGRDPKAGELGRTPDQRRADALVEMARRSAACPPTANPPKPLFTLVLGSDQFRHLCQLANGQVLSPAALAPWIDDADLERILFADDAPSRVIDVSRKRSFRGALRRLIEVRDQTCYHPMCDVPADRCEIDHIEPWAWGGPTSQDNGRPACAFHNRLRHQRPPPA